MTIESVARGCLVGPLEMGWASTTPLLTLGWGRPLRRGSLAGSRRDRRAAGRARRASCTRAAGQAGRLGWPGSTWGWPHWREGSGINTNPSSPHGTICNLSPSLPSPSSPLPLSSPPWQHHQQSRLNPVFQFGMHLKSTRLASTCLWFSFISARQMGGKRQARQSWINLHHICFRSPWKNKCFLLSTTTSLTNTTTTSLTLPTLSLGDWQCVPPPVPAQDGLHCPGPQGEAAAPALLHLHDMLGRTGSPSAPPAPSPLPHQEVPLLPLPEPGLHQHTGAMASPH